MAPEVRERIGPYRTAAVVGWGATGTVYRCLDEQSRSVAVKVPRPGREAQWRSEVTTLRRLSKRGVPGIVRILGTGQGPDAWYSMALVSGPSLREVLQQLQLGATPAGCGQTEPVARCGSEPQQGSQEIPPLSGAVPDVRGLLPAIAAVAATLSHLHAAGVAHGDLKPENIVFGQDQQPVLIDFGSASVSMGEDLREASVAIPQPWMTAGYIAPEIARGEPATPRSDLFSLGCMLFEILTGRVPGRSSAPLLVWPATTSEQASADLRRLVEGLLQPNPSERAYFAADVAEALEQLGAATLLSDAGALPRALHRPQHVGRADALALMLQAIRQLPERPGGLILVEGEGGIGKTRLLTQVLTLARELSPRFIVARADEDGQNVSSTSLRESLREALREASSERSPPAFVVAVLAEPSPQGPALPSAQQAQAELFRSLLWLAEARAVVMVVDDLDRVGDGTRALLEALARSSMRNILVIVSCQSGKVGSLGDLARGCRERIALVRLAEDELRLLLRDTLATPHVPSSMSRLIFQRSAGNPRYALELCRAALESGVVRRAGNGWLVEAPAELSSSLPATLDEALQERCQRLSSPAQSLLWMVTLLGAERESVLLSLSRGAFQIDAAVAEAALDEVLQSGALRLSGDLLELEHPILSEFLRARMPPLEQWRIHRWIATWLEQERTRAGRDVGAQLGTHWLGAGEPERALKWLIQAGSQCAALLELRRAERCLVQALACVEAIVGEAPARAVDLASTQLQIWESLAEVRSQLGWFDEATVAWRQVVENVGDPWRRARALRRWGALLMSKSQFEGAEQKYSAALAELGVQDALAPEHQDEWRETQLLRIENIYYQRDTRRMRDVVEQLRPALHRGSAPQRGKLGLCAANLLFQEAGFSYTAAAGELWLDAIGLLDQSPNEQQAAAFARVDLGMAMLFGAAQDWAPASQHLADGVRGADRVSDLKLLARGRAYLATVLRRLKRVSEAEAEACSCVDTAEACQIAAYVAVGWGNLGWAALMRGDDVAAVTLTERALALWRGLEVPYPMQWIAAFPLLAALTRADPLNLTLPLELLLDPQQQPLPDELASALRITLRAEGAARSEAARAALLSAHRLGFV